MVRVSFYLHNSEPWHLHAHYTSYKHHLGEGATNLSDGSDKHKQGEGEGTLYLSDEKASALRERAFSEFPPNFS